MSFRDRVTELRRVRAGDLQPHPANWRSHDDSQRSALGAMLEEIGFAGAVVARETGDGLQIIDGHLRSGMDPDALVPVLITDLDEDEAAKLLATFDPIGKMAGTDADALRSLLDSISTSSGDVEALLKRVAFDAQVFPDREKAPKPPPRPDPHMAEGDAVAQVVSGEADWAILEGDVLERLRDLPDGCVQTVVTSPPYWGLRDYGTADWEGGDAECPHTKVDVEAWVQGRKDRPNPSNSGIGKAGPTFEAQTSGMAAFRDVCGKCGAVRVDEQIGLEPTFGAWIDKLVEVFAEVRRVLRDDGTAWLNLGDAYASGDTKTTGRADSQDPERPGRAVGSTRGGTRTTRKMSANEPRSRPELPDPPAGWSSRDVTVARVAVEGVKQKDLLGQPWAVAFALRADGWFLRSEIIWAKPNPMPESVTDRPTKAHEQVFLLSKSSRYHYDAEAVRQEASYGVDVDPTKWNGVGSAQREPGPRSVPATNPDPSAGANMRDVWTIATEAFAEAHFATFPRKLVEPCVKAGTSEAGACPTCGAAWVREGQAHVEGVPRNEAGAYAQMDGSDGTRSDLSKTDVHGTSVFVTTGWKPGCDCSQAEAIGCLVLDPFAGSGTVGVVALGNGQRFLGIELNPAYAQMARDRIARFREEQDGA